MIEGFEQKHLGETPTYRNERDCKCLLQVEDSRRQLNTDTAQKPII